MQYVLLIYGDEKSWANVSEAEKGKAFGEMAQVAGDLSKNGSMRGGNALQPSSTATTVRVRDGKRLTTDGPFAETKEQLGGYFVIEANHLDEAIEVAARLPSSRYGSVEVRPVMQMPERRP